MAGRFLEYPTQIRAHEVLRILETNASDCHDRPVKKWCRSLNLFAAEIQRCHHSSESIADCHREPWYPLQGPLLENFLGLLQRKRRNKRHFL